MATCSNDGRICLWRVDTTSFNVTMRLNFEGSDFVYSLCSFNGGMTIASAGETTGVKVSQVFSTSGLSSLGVPGVPDFGRSVNSISTKGNRLCPPNYYWHTQIFGPDT